MLDSAITNLPATLVATGKSAYGEKVEQTIPDRETLHMTSNSEVFDTGKKSRSRMIGLVTVLTLMVSGTFTFLMLFGFAPVNPDFHAVVIAVSINGLLILILVFLIGKEVVKLMRSRKKGRAAARLHTRIIGLFCLVAALPAVLVAIVAGITLDLGLDRWFEIRTRKIIESSVSVARAYQNETTRVLMGNTLSMAASLNRNRQLYVLDKERFIQLFTIEARGRGLLTASIVNGKGVQLLASRLPTQDTQPLLPELALELASDGDIIPIPPGNTNLVGAVLKLHELSDAYLYTVVAVPPSVIEALQTTEFNSASYNALEENRLPFQLAFALLYFGVCLIVLLSAIWMGISVANRIVTPIRRLMFAAGEVSNGNLDVRVSLQGAEGDLHFLNETFNVMLVDLRDQQGKLLKAKELMDQRARFIEAVLSGVSAGVIGLDANGCVGIANRSALSLLDLENITLDGTQNLSDRTPELGDVFWHALESGKPQHHEQITLNLYGKERTLNVQVTVEKEETPIHSYVMTIDDITDLVAAQRNTAWSDIARRIAHEIKNPLTPIQLSAERIRRRYGKVITEDREIFDNCTETIIRQVGDIGRMVDEFSAFAQMPKPEMALGDIRTIIKDTYFLQKVGFPEISFKLYLPDEPLYAVFDTRMLSQGLINVIKNAAEAIEGRTNENAERGYIEINIRREKGNAVIEITDNGRGLPSENRQRLMEPYMTTRDKGTGLGLAIVRKIAEDHNGQIELLDAPQVAEGKCGAMMRIILPLHWEEDSIEQSEKSRESV